MSKVENVNQMTEKEILTVIKQFVEGELDIVKFEYICKNSKDFREYVKDIEDNILENLKVNMLQFLDLKFDSVSRQYDLFSVFRWFLVDKNIKHNYTEYYIEQARKEAEIIPDYLCDEAKEWVEENIINKVPENLNKSEKKKWIKEQIKKTFKYEKKKPIWVQGTEEWPKDKDGEFLIFRKQKEKGEEVTYTFYNPKTNEEVEIVEFY